VTAATRSPLVRAVLRSALLVVLSTTALVVIAPSAHAAPAKAKSITRDEIVDRAREWVEDDVSYSQSAYHQGYRQDCSGFVSMAWATGRSYTTRSLHHVSHKVPRSKVKKGDAVLTPGHVVIFEKWKNRDAGTFYAYEETTWGRDAERRVRTMTRSSTVLRRDGLAKPAPKSDPAPSSLEVKQLMLMKRDEPRITLEPTATASSEFAGPTAMTRGF
jgi:hypothetical protein